jgi:hypothetical protein
MSPFASTVKELGLSNAIWYGIDRTSTKLGFGPRVFYYDLVVQPIASERLLPKGLGRSIAVRPIPKGDPALSSMPVPEKVLDWRFEQPTVCLGAFQEERLIAYVWLCLGAYEEDEVRCRFVPCPEDEAVWDFDVYVFPEYRFSPAFARLWDTCSRISRFNPSSQRAHERMAARRVGRALYLKAKRVQWMLASVPPFLHLSLGDANRPRICVRTDVHQS